MPNYRAYIVGNDGHFQSCEYITADNDKNAIAIADKLASRSDVELWHLTRRIAVLAHKHRISPLPHKDESVRFEKIAPSPTMW